MRRVLGLLLLLSGMAFGSATDIYLTPLFGGTCLGNPAFQTTFFNLSTNWGSLPSQIGPGTTVHLCGTFTGGVGANILSFQGNGSSGNPITLKWEAGASISVSSCKSGIGGSNSGCINLNGHTFLVIDMNNQPNAITATANGSPPLANHLDSVAIFSSTFTNNELKNCSITNMYVHSSTTDVAGGFGYGLQTSGMSNSSVHDCSFDQIYAGVDDSYQNGDNNVQIYNNTFNHFNWGVHIGNNAASSLTNVLIHNNHLKDMNNWDTTTDAFHHDGIFVVQNNTSATITNIFIYNNLGDGNMSQCTISVIGPSGSCATAWIFYNTGMNGIYLFNNVLQNPNGSVGFMLEGGFTGDKNFFFYNNFIDCGSTGNGLNYSNVTGWVFENNAMQNCNVAGGTKYFQLSGIANKYSDYNVYKNFASGETNSVNTANLLVNSSGVPQAGSPLIGIGPNLGALCSGNLTALCTDAAGNARPALIFSKQNIDDSSTGNRLCWAGGSGSTLCTPGGSGTVTVGPTQTFVNASPSLDGNSEKIAFTGTAFTDVLYLYEAGANNSATYLQGDYQVFITAGNYQDLEFDTYQYLHASLDQFMYGSQCQIGGFWQIWNSLLGTWVNTSVTCSLSTGTWHHITWNVHRIAGDTSCASSHPCMYYDTLTINGITNVPGCPSTPCKQPAGVLPGTFTDQTGLNFQMDTNGSGGALQENLDEVGFTGFSSLWDVGAFQFTGAAPAVTLGPPNLTFGTVNVGSVSSPQSVTIQNVGTATLHVSVTTLIPFINYLISSRTCPADPFTLAAGASCSVSIEFAPGSAGPLSSTLSFTDDASGSPHLAGLSGTGLAVAPAVSLSPTTLAFADQIINTSSSSKTIHLTNTGGSTLNITSITLTTGTQFSKTTSCVATLAPGTTCDVGVTFLPTSVGFKSDTVTFTTNASSSPDTVSVSGTGVVAPTASACNFNGGIKITGGITCK